MRFHALVAGMVSCAATVCTSAQTANFDSFTEGFNARSITDNGITFSNLDNRLDPPPGSLAIERAEGTLSGQSGFTPNNCLGFGGYSPGPGAAFGRCGSFDITWDGTDRSNASLWVYEFFADNGNKVALEAYDNGVLVASDAFTTVGGGLETHELTITGVTFNSLRIYASGAANQGCMFGLVDSVTISGSGSDLSLLPPDPGVAGTRNDLTATGADAGKTVYFVYGLNDGTANVPNCPGLVVDISHPEVAGSARADGSGTAILNVFVPGAAAGRTVLLQAVQPNGCLKSNLVRATFE